MRIAFLALVMGLTASSAFAHPGGTASDGCHYCRTNCAQWGVATGQRHCHGQTPTPEPDSEDLSGRAVVIDGDTIDVADSRIRLYGIDAPESQQTCRAEGGGGPALGLRGAGHPCADRPDRQPAGRV